MVIDKDSKESTGPSSSAKDQGQQDKGRAQPAKHTERHLAVLLNGPGRVVRDAGLGKDLHEIPICITGAWVKGGRKFAIDARDLAAMVRNFSKRRNEQVVIDYEHASEQPEVAQGGPIPAAGWIHELQVSGPRCQVLGEPETRNPSLRARVEWTPDAAEMIRKGQYRFFSPAIDWDARDKETGEPQGATLTSGALTNHPFLEELPPIMLTDAGVATLAVLPNRGSAVRGRSSVAIEHARRTANVRAADTPNPYLDRPSDRDGKGAETMAKKLSITKLTDGPDEGHHGIFDGDAMLGYVDANDLREHVKQNGDDFDDLFATDASEQLAERLGVATGTTFAEVKRLVGLGRTSESAELGEASRRLLLTEAVKEGKLDNLKASQLARANQITLADYIAASEAEKAIDAAVKEGKILPRDRAFFFSDALARPQEFSEWVKNAIPVLKLGTTGIGAGQPMSVDDEVRVRTEKLMEDKKVPYAKALKQVLASDTQLARRYHAAHRRQASENTGTEAAAGITA